MPRGARRVQIQAIDEAGNRGAPVAVAVSSSGGDGGGGNDDEDSGGGRDDGSDDPAGVSATAGEGGSLAFTGLALAALVLLALALLAAGRLGYRAARSGASDS